MVEDTSLTLSETLSRLSSTASDLVDADKLLKLVHYSKDVKEEDREAFQMLVVDLQTELWLRLGHTIGSLEDDYGSLH